jgi:hypothetical protein
MSALDQKQTWQTILPPPKADMDQHSPLCAKSASEQSRRHGDAERLRPLSGAAGQDW